MRKRQTIAGHNAERQAVPQRILLSDARNDAMLDRALARLRAGDALVFRHYHLRPEARRARYLVLRGKARARGILLIGARIPAGWGAEGSYGTPREVAGKRGLRLATAHSLREIGAAVRAGAHAIVLSPVFPTRSHPGAHTLGPVRFLLLAQHCPLPVIALGGMTAARAARLPVHGWAAIDGWA